MTTISFRMDEEEEKIFNDIWDYYKANNTLLFKITKTDVIKILMLQKYNEIKLKEDLKSNKSDSS